MTNEEKAKPIMQYVGELEAKVRERDDIIKSRICQECFDIRRNTGRLVLVGAAMGFILGGGFVLLLKGMGVL